jgi:hypothetical protein
MTTLYITRRELPELNRLLKDHGYNSTIRDLKLFDRYLTNIFMRLGVEYVDQKSIVKWMSLYREMSG